MLGRDMMNEILKFLLHYVDWKLVHDVIFTSANSHQEIDTWGYKFQKVLWNILPTSTWLSHSHGNWCKNKRQFPLRHERVKTTYTYPSAPEKYKVAMLTAKNQNNIDILKYILSCSYYEYRYKIFRNYVKIEWNTT